MREEVRDWLLLGLKTILFVLGGVLILAALLNMAVGTPWFVRHDSWAATFEKSPILVLLLGLLLAVPPLALAFRDAYHAARQGRLGGEP